MIFNDVNIRVCIDGKTRTMIKYYEEENNMQRSKLRRDNILRCIDEIPYIKAHRRIKYRSL